MIKTIINLCCKVSRLRRENKRLLHENSITSRNLALANRLIASFENKPANYSTLMFSVPQSNVFMKPACIDELYRDLCAEARFAEFKERQLTDEMKIEMFNQLLQQGFIQQKEPNSECTRYEIHVVRL